MKSIRLFALVAIVLGTSACASRPTRPEAVPVAVAAPSADPDQKGTNDPWEGYNRRMYGFNSAVDKAVIRPVAVAYESITPDPVKTSVTRFFGNLGEPATAVNQVLQVRPLKAAQTVGRFVVNSTVGVAGLFDPATRLGIAREQEDFGQTLATWGWHDSRYFVIKADHSLGKSWRKLKSAPRLVEPAWAAASANRVRRCIAASRSAAPPSRAV